MKRLMIMPIGILVAFLMFSHVELLAAKGSTPLKKGYKLLWADEFNKAGRPDPSVWTAEEGGNGWGNNESQFYTKRRQNVEVKNGKLYITALKEDYLGKSYTSARLITKGKKEFTYGRVEVSAKLPAGKGTWPAIWMLGANIASVPWPACGEIDIMEHVGFDMNVVHGSIHTKAYNHPNGTQKTAKTQVDDVAGKFHLYAVEWTPESVDFFIDNIKFYSYKPDEYNADKWPFNAPCFLILNLAVGGNWGGEIDGSSFPKVLEVDYVRVYQPL